MTCFANELVENAAAARPQPPSESRATRYFATPEFAIALCRGVNAAATSPLASDWAGARSVRSEIFIVRHAARSQRCGRYLCPPRAAAGYAGPVVTCSEFRLAAPQMEMVEIAGNGLIERRSSVEMRRSVVPRIRVIGVGRWIGQHCLTVLQINKKAVAPGGDGVGMPVFSASSAHVGPASHRIEMRRAKAK